MENITSKQYAAKIVEVAYHEVLPNKETVCNIVTALIDEYANYKNKWISVEDRLPTERYRYLCYVTEQNDLGKSNYVWNCYYSFENGWCDNSKIMNVTHWMSLPDAPISKTEA